MSRRYAMLLAGIAAASILAACGLGDSVTESGTISSVTPTQGGCAVEFQPDNGQTTHVINWTNRRWCALVGLGSYRLHKQGTPEVQQRIYPLGYRLVSLGGDCRPVYVLRLSGGRTDQLVGPRPTMLGYNACSDARAMIAGRSTHDPSAGVSSAVNRLQMGQSSPGHDIVTPMKPLPASNGK